MSICPGDLRAYGQSAAKRNPCRVWASPDQDGAGMGLFHSPTAQSLSGCPACAGGRTANFVVRRRDKYSGLTPAPLTNCELRIKRSEMNHAREDQLPGFCTTHPPQERPMKWG